MARGLGGGELAELKRVMIRESRARRARGRAGGRSPLTVHRSPSRWGEENGTGGGGHGEGAGDPVPVTGGRVFDRDNGRVFLVAEPSACTVPTCSRHDRAHLVTDGAFRLVPATRLNGQARPRMYPPGQMLVAREQHRGFPERVIGRVNFEAACDELYERQQRLRADGLEVHGTAPIGLVVREAMAKAEARMGTGRFLGLVRGKLR